MSPIVTIVCVTYNHKDYIKDAIEGFLKQKTTFDFNIIIHDDASTDGTREIIKQYMDKYPNKIIGILQEENQYSKGIDICSKFILPVIEKDIRYIACCDGDDYWIDANKLQMQFDYMEKHKKCVCCGCNAIIHNLYTGEKKNINKKIKDCNIKPKKRILGGINLKPSSWMIRADIYVNANDEIAEWGGYTDFPMGLYMLSKGYLHYIGRPMIVYRYGTPGSWSSNTCGKRDFTYILELEKPLRIFDDATNHKYRIYVNYEIKKNRYNFLMWTGEYKQIIKEFGWIVGLRGYMCYDEKFRSSWIGRLVIEINRIRTNTLKRYSKK